MSTVFIPSVLRPMWAASSRSMSTASPIRERRRRAGRRAPVAQGPAADRRWRPQPVRQRLRQRPGRPLPAGARRRRSPEPTRSACCRRWPAAEADRHPAGVPAAPTTTAGPRSTRTRTTALAPHGGRYDDILDAIGHTPLVEIPRMSPNPAVRIFAKLEMLNPTGSVKDRAAKYLIEDLERRGQLHDRLDHPRADLGQHRDRAGDDRAAQGLSRRAGHAGQRHQ